jgi:hypothetical protein
VGDLATFGHLSRVLTGERFLAEDLVARHLARLRGDADAAPMLARLLDSFARRAAESDFDEEAFRQEVTPDAELGPLVRRIVVLWITGALPKVDWATTPKLEQALDYQEGDPRPFFGALMWPAMGAHPPGLSGGYFGYWRYPPES